MIRNLMLAATVCVAVGFFSPAATAQDTPPTATTYYVLDTATGQVTAQRIEAVERDTTALKTSHAELTEEVGRLRKLVESLNRSSAPTSTPPAGVVVAAAAPPCPCIEATGECPCRSSSGSVKPASGKTRTIQVCDGKSCRLIEVADDGPAASVTAPATSFAPTAGTCSGGSCSTGRSGRTGWYLGKNLGR